MAAVHNGGDDDNMIMPADKRLSFSGAYTTQPEPQESA